MGTIREWSDDDLNSKGTIPDRFSCKTNSRWSFFHPLKSLINPRYHIQTHSAWANFQSRETRARKFYKIFVCSLYIQLFSKARIRTFIHVNQKERSCTAKNVSLENEETLFECNMLYTHGSIPAPIECWSFQSFWQVFITGLQANSIFVGSFSQSRYRINYAQ